MTNLKIYDTFTVKDLKEELNTLFDQMQMSRNVLTRKELGDKIDYIEQTLKRLTATTREMCGLCHKVVRVGFHVPDDIWKQVVHPHYLRSIHCLECFTTRADEKMIAWDKDIKFYPVSLKSHLTPGWKPKLQ